MAYQRQEVPDGIRTRLYNDWLKGKSTPWKDVTVEEDKAQSIVDNSTFDELFEDFDYFHCAQIYAHMRMRSPWYIPADEFIGMLEHLDDDDRLMLKLGFG